jgi:DNA-binding LytR/AlgR family response regulator
MINCIAIDDEPLALVIMEEFCARVPYLNLQKTFTDTDEAARYLNKFPVDLLFLDINMPDKNGIDFCKQYAQNKMVIFTTAYSEYAVEGFNVSAIDYLLKPVEMERFIQATFKANEFYRYQHSNESMMHQYLFVRAEYSLVKIPFSEIGYIETLDDYLKIHVTGKKPVLTKMNLKNVMSKLNEKEFIRVHRSYIVPLSRIKSVRGKVIALDNISIPIGVKFEEEFFKAYTNR